MYGILYIIYRTSCQMSQKEKKSIMIFNEKEAILHEYFVASGFLNNILKQNKKSYKS